LGGGHTGHSPGDTGHADGGLHACRAWFAMLDGIASTAFARDASSKGALGVCIGAAGDTAGGRLGTGL